MHRVLRVSSWDGLFFNIPLRPRWMEHWVG